MKNAADKGFCQRKRKLTKNEARVAYEMKILMSRYGSTYASQKKIGDRAGMTRQTVNPILGFLHLEEYLYKIYRGIKRTCTYFPKWPALKKSFFSIFDCQSELSDSTKDTNLNIALASLREPVPQPIVAKDAGRVKTSSKVIQWFESTLQVENSFEAYILRAIGEKYGCGFCQIAVELSQVPYKFCECGIMKHAAPFLMRIV